MKNISCVNAAGQGAGLGMGKVCSIKNVIATVIIGLFCILSFAQNSFGQAGSIFWTDLDSFRVGYQLSTDATTLQSNEQFSINLYLEALSPISAAGGSFDLLFSDLVSPESTSLLTIPEQSWLGLDEDLSAQQIGAGSPTSINLEVARQDYSLKSGSGMVLSVNFVVGNLSLSASQVMTALGGDLIMDENMEMQPENNLRLTSYSTLSPLELAQPQTLKVFPNPFMDWIQVEGGNSTPANIRIFDLKGNLLLTAQPDDQGKVYPTALPSGTFILHLLDQNGQTLDQRRVQKR